MCHRKTLEDHALCNTPDRKAEIGCEYHKYMQTVALAPRSPKIWILSPYASVQSPSQWSPILHLINALAISTEKNITFFGLQYNFREKDPCSIWQTNLQCIWTVIVECVFHWCLGGTLVLSFKGKLKTLFFQKNVPSSVLVFVSCS